MMSLRVAIATLALAAASASCASNSLPLASATAVNTALERATDKFQTGLAEARRQQKFANATLIASDPSCGPRQIILVYIPNGAATDEGKKDPATGKVITPAPLCAEAPDKARKGYDIVEVAILGPPQEMLAPSVALLTALTSYTTAVAKIAAEPAADVSDELDTFLSNATKAAGIVDKIAGSKLSGALGEATKTLAGEQAKSALALIEFAVELQHEAQSVERLRTFIKDSKGKFETIAAELRPQLTQTLDIIGKGSSQEAVGNLTRAYAGAKASLSFDQRLALVERTLDAMAAVEDAGSGIAALDKALKEVEATHANLQRQLRGEFTEEEKRKIAKENQARLFKAAGLIGEALAQFGGL